MGWKIEKRKGLHLKRWEWEWYSSAYGLAYGYARTKREAEKRLAEAQEWFLRETQDA